MSEYWEGMIIGGLEGLFAGIVLMLIIRRRKNSPLLVKTREDFNPKVEIKKENLEKLKNFIREKSKGEKITNNEIEKLLGVSDATAERYLDEMESAGIILQVGKEGKSVFYEKV